MSDLEPKQPQSAPATSTDTVSHDARYIYRRRDPIGAITGGLVLIVLGIVFMLAQNGWFGVTWANMWGMFLIGLGGILLLQALLRLVLPDYRRNVSGLVIGAFILIAIGMIPFAGMDWAKYWPVALIGIGVVMLLQQFTRW